VRSGGSVRERLGQLEQPPETEQAPDQQRLPPARQCEHERRQLPDPLVPSTRHAHHLDRTDGHLPADQLAAPPAVEPKPIRNELDSTNGTRLDAQLLPDSRKRAPHAGTVAPRTTIGIRTNA
jgi:hypothetical protein